MSSFTSLLVVSPLSNGRDWLLLKKFTYHLGSEYSRRWVKVPKNFITDFASIPKFLWWLPYWAKFSKAPVLHDWLYREKQIMGKPITRKRADDIFLEAMRVDFRIHGKLGYVIAKMEWIAVRFLGFVVWRKNHDSLR